MPFAPTYTDTTSLPSSSPQRPCTERTSFLLLVLPSLCLQCAPSLATLKVPPSLGLWSLLLIPAFPSRALACLSPLPLCTAHVKHFLP